MPRKHPKDMSPAEKFSRTLSKTLRHKAKQQGFSISANGWVPVQEILDSKMYKSQNVSMEMICNAVETNNKKRYEFDETKQHIRACQGHSLDVEIDSMTLLTKETLPPIVVHGTTAAAWKLIQQSGLSKMDRQHIHLASGLPGTVVSGMRNSSKVFVYVDAPRALEDGIPFYMATNGAILSPGRDGIIPIDYLRVEFK